MIEILKTDIPKRVRFFVFFIVVLVLAYTVWADSIFFFYLIWNIFLAFIPLLISAGILWCRNNNGKNLLFFIVGFFLWLIFFPNAPYVVTDVIHLGSDPSVPILLDIFIIFSYAFVGMYFAVKSLAHIEQFFKSFFEEQKANILIIITILLSSFGIYLGRYLRWNSWDTFFNPKNLFLDIVNIFAHRSENIDAYTTTLFFFVFIVCSYYSWKYFKEKCYTLKV